MGQTMQRRTLLPLGLLLLELGLNVEAGSCPLTGQSSSKMDEYHPMVACLEYQSDSCCPNYDSSRHINRILQTYETLYSKCTSCLRNLRSMQCAMYCSSKQGQYVKVAGETKTLSICSSFCETLYESCRNCTLGNVTGTIDKVWTNAKGFCSERNLISEWGTGWKIKSDGAPESGCFINKDVGVCHKCNNCAYDKSPRVAAKKVEVARKKAKNPFNFFLAFCFLMIYLGIAFAIGCRVRGLWRGSVGLEPYGYKEIYLEYLCLCRAEDPDEAKEEDDDDEFQ